jgi:hypothetical protein
MEAVMTRAELSEKLNRHPYFWAIVIVSVVSIILGKLFGHEFDPPRTQKDDTYGYIDHRRISRQEAERTIKTIEEVTKLSREDSKRLLDSYINR